MFSEPTEEGLQGTMIDMGRDGKMIMFSCPYEECGGTVLVSPSQVMCGVFRHAVMKTTGRPIDPHCSRERCEVFVREGKVFGCAQPFRVLKRKSGNEVLYFIYKCGYV